MSESSALQWLRAPRLAEDTLPNDAVTVDCKRCGRSVQVSLSPMRPSCFLHVDDQVECPEVQERWTGNGDGGLLLMMCGALERSLDADWEAEEAAVAARHAPAPVVPPLHPRSAPERADAESWNDDQGDEQDDAGRIGWLHGLFARIGRPGKRHVRTAIGVVSLIIVVLGGLVLPFREMKLLIQSQPGPAGASNLQRDALPVTSPRRIATETASSAASTQEMPLGARSVSNSAAVPRQPPAMETAPSKLLAEATASLQTAMAAQSAAGPAPKLRAPEMVQIAGGTFAMGGDDDSEQPVHQVSIRSFALGKYPVTVGEWKQCVAAASCADIAAGADDRPVANVSYDDAQAYLAWLAKVTGKPFRLPSEAEWEYAARGGQRSKYWWGDRMRSGMANCKGCNNNNDAAEAAQPLKVGSFQPNSFGLFDMGGGVGQWVADNWHKNYKGAPADGAAWLEEGNYARVIRSGSWTNGPADARAGSRDRYDGRIRHPTLGFRVALSP
ncbi:formylglycine-generating enzyme family protein [Bradyrhizobium ontarionense]|uniref:Formylglycine-generating enzyme family protein n=1 Tax=Bradyrhizobium ontarionense TaxID=2898149 RepID=A0ABY3R959_9BRAD|nr:formylglycine-generating enzyme family protein [Bradyrhizobium sp. A19]UFZ03341.1 formylglycine-generating enzyme family protein [Bradyrhizobium sp. A19]